MHHKAPTHLMCFLHVHFGTTAFYNENTTNEETKILKAIGLLRQRNHNMTCHEF
jgi:hypothetical protein